MRSGAWRGILVPLGTRRSRLRMLAHTRRLVLLMGPLGALMGVLTAWVLTGLEHLEHRLFHLAAWGHWTLALPGLGLVATALWLQRTGVGPVSLAADLHHAHHDPRGTFPLRRSLAKVAACTFTIACGASAGVEGPGKWLGAAAGIQVHRFLAFLARHVPLLRRWLVQPGVVLTAGASGVLAAIFRAPLSGALLAAEEGGVVRSDRLVAGLVAAATGYLAFVAVSGRGPLLPLVAAPGLDWHTVAWAVPLGLLCGLAARLYGGVRNLLRLRLASQTLLGRALWAALGLSLLALPSFLAWENLPVTRGGGLDLVGHLLASPPGTRIALAFLALKLLATALTFEGGGVGGTWLPSVAMGACLGSVMESLVPTGHPGLMVLLGATALTGAVHGTLLVPVVFLAETTGQAGLVVPGLVAASMAFLVGRARD